MNQTIIKNLRPIDQDIHFKYKCPVCGINHWLSLEETKTKGFKVVCDCKTVLKVKKIQNIKIKYHRQHTKPNVDLSKSNIDKAITTLGNYGFTLEECQKLTASCNIQKNDTVANIVKKSLAYKFGEIQNGKCD
jgi:hypothetical protein